LAMVALFTGGFLVFSAQALQVARRRGEHALLRVLGLRRRGVLQLVLLEAAALGAIGGLVGLALGYALALAAVRASGADLGAGVFRGLSPKLDFSLVPAFFYLAAGIAVAAAGALLPALDAARQAPAQALKAGDEQRLFARLSSPWPGLAFILAGAALAQLGPVGGLPIYGYAAIGCLLVGSIALMPRISQAVFDALPLPRSPGLALALAQLRGAPGQAAVSPAAVWISEAVSDLYGFSPGRKIQLPINGQSIEFVVAGVFRDYARQHGSVLIDRADYAALTGDRRVNDAALWLTPDATPAQAMD